MKYHLILILLLTFSIYGKEELTADAIIDRSLEHKVFSYENSEADLTMILIDKKAKEKEVRTLKIKSKTKDKKSKTLSVFSGGREINGVKFLSIELNDKKHEQYVYYPAQNKINRIVSKSSQNEYFLGTDFTYYDLEGKYRKDGVFTKLKDAKIGKHPVYVIQAVSKKESVYSKVLVYIRKSDFMPLKVKFYDKKNQYFKVYMVKKIKVMNGQKVIAKSVVINKKKNHETRLILKHIQFNTDIPDSIFNRENLR